MLNTLGLTTQEAQRRLEQYGRNEIKRYEKIKPTKIFLVQFTSPLVLILIAAAIISVIIGYLPGQEPDFVDAALILIIVFVSGISGFFQEYKAEKSIEALQEMAAPKTLAIRDGQPKEISVSEVVVGDVLLLESGDIVPADAKLIESFNVAADESALTGESEAVTKKVADTIFMNSFIYIGNAKAEVIKTGLSTKVGEIAKKLQAIKTEKTSFEKEITLLSKKIFKIIAVVTVVIFLVSLFKYSLYAALLTAVSLAVAAIPEGLPAIVVLSLAIGAKALARKQALIRKLGVAESIGAVDIICTDKTGTLTKNEMAVTKLYINENVIETKQIKNNAITEIELLIRSGILCNNVQIVKDKDNIVQYLGEQTEIGLVKFGEKIGLNKNNLIKKYKLINEQSFTSERKMMSITTQEIKTGVYQIYAKGAPEVLLKKCDRIYINGVVQPLADTARKEILKHNKGFASSALRVLGFAWRGAQNENDDEEKNLIWIGLQAMIDPPHPEVKSVLEECRNAGIRVIMITGDSAITASAIAKEINLKSNGRLTGKELDKMTDNELEQALNKDINIFARTNPFHKLRILNVLEKENRVAMTGDGVNDSLALKQANVGIAMGLRGTAVAKNACDMILLDDNFKTIVSSIKEGRKIFDNIRKFINYLLVSNFAEVGVLLVATLFISIKEPILLPMQILWINLLTDGLPALALGVDPARPDIMSKPPRPKNDPIIDKRLAWLIGTIGIKKICVLLATFIIVLPLGIDVARTTLFTGFILYEFVRISSIRYQEKLHWFSNKWLIGALGISLVLQMVIIYTPLSSFFHIVPLGLFSWSVLLSGIVVGYILAILITKIVIRYTNDKIVSKVR